jgi:hypothetical protein
MGEIVNDADGVSGGVGPLHAAANKVRSAGAARASKADVLKVFNGNHPEIQAMVLGLHESLEALAGNLIEVNQQTGGQLEGTAARVNSTSEATANIAAGLNRP